MVGGKVIGIIRKAGEPTTVNVQDTRNEDTAAVRVWERRADDGTPVQIGIGDSIWWQGREAMWTPQSVPPPHVGGRAEGCAVTWDIHLPVWATRSRRRGCYEPYFPLCDGGVMTGDEIRARYREFLDSWCGWQVHVCDACGRHYTHPGNYCGKCPGKLNVVRMTWGEYLARERQQGGLIGAQVTEFRAWLRGRYQIETSNNDVQDDCYAVIYELRRSERKGCAGHNAT